MQHIAIKSSDGSFPIRTGHHVDEAVSLYSSCGDDVGLSNGPVLLKEVSDVPAGGTVTQVAHKNLKVA